MIKTIDIQGFQSHLNTTLYLHPGLNVVFGETDSGKSAIYRALEFAALNKLPRIKSNGNRDEYINWDLKDNNSATIRIEFDDGTFIEREKTPTGKINQYNITGFDEPLVALRQQLPKEVFAISKMEAANFQSQKHLYFLLNESAGTVAKEFNKLSNIEISDIILKLLRSDSLLANSQIKAADTEIKRLDNELHKYNSLEEAQKEFYKLEKLEKTIKKYSDKCETLVEVYNQFIDTSEELEKFKPVSFAAKEAKKLKKQEEVIFELKETRDASFLLSQQLIAAKRELGAYKHIAPAKKQLKKLITEQKKIDALETTFAVWVAVYNSYVELQENDVTSELSKAEKALDTMQKHLRVCPLCKSPFKGK